MKLTEISRSDNEAKPLFLFHSKFFEKRGIHYEIKIPRWNLCTAFCNQKTATKARCAGI